MPNTMIVKQSDVSHGTALHLADNWSYGRNSLCGKPMRATARDFEISYKRVCGTCAKIMAKRVEKAHAEALRELSFQAGDTVQYTGTDPEDDPTKVGVVQAVDGEKLTIRWDDNDVDVMYVGRIVHFTYEADSALELAKDRLDIADFDEEAVYAQAAAQQENTDCPPVCEHGKTADEGCLAGVCGTVADCVHPTALLENAEKNPVFFRIIDTRTGTVRHILGTSLATNAPRKTVVWVQREGEKGVQAWSADELMSTWHDLAAIDDNGNTLEMLEFAEVARFEQDEADRLATMHGPGDRTKTLMSMRYYALIGEGGHSGGRYHRYAQLVCKHGRDLPPVRLA